MTWPNEQFEVLYAVPSRNGVYKSKEFHGEGYRMVNMGELFAFDFISDQEMNRIELNDAELLTNSLQDGDLLFGRRSLVEAGAGKCSLVVEPTESLTFESSIIRVRLDKRAVNPRFYFYYFRSPLGRGQIWSIVSGTNVKGIRGTDLKKLCVARPPKDTQDRIADILSAYDELIENNRRRMRLLEEAARLLYREWFVRFRFPGHERTRILDALPQGWERKTLGDLCSEIRETVSPEDVDPDTPYIGLEHMPRRSISLSAWDRADAVTSTKHRFKRGDILFGKIRSYFHKVGVAFSDGITSSDAIVIRPNADELRGLVLMTASSDHFVAVASTTAREGSKMPRADWKVMVKFAIAMPPDSLLRTFSDAIDPIINQLRTLTFQNRNLRAARDLLLPRLMSGQIHT